MNGFDQFASSETGASGAERAEPSYPNDFTQDEELFASELRGIFDIEREDLPAGYVPTVLGYERHAPARPGFERRISRSVFRELNLPGRPLFERNPILQFGVALVEPVQQLRHAGRAAIGVLASVMLVMVMSMVFATPSFADGLQILLGHTGVQQVADYPRNVHNSEAQQIAPVNHQETLPPLYWLGSTVGDYSYLGMRTLPKEAWSKGQIVDLQYVLTHPTNGSGVLDVRMFQVSDKYAAVLKVVHTGSAHAAEVNNTRAIFVDGAWQSVGARQVWRSGLRSEVIMEKDGVIFWIVGDPRDGLTEAQLLAAAGKLTPATRRDLLSSQLTVGSVGRELRTLFRAPVGGELYALVARGDTANTDLDLVLPASSRQVNMN